MKLFFLLICFSLLHNLAKSQTGRITYDAIINRSQEGTPRSEMVNDDLNSTGWLIFDSNSATYRQLLPDSTIIIRTGGGIVGRSRTKYPISVNDTLGSIYKINYQTNTIQERIPFYNLKNFYVVSDKVIPIKWKITNEKKMIGKFKVVKAESDYLGRKWFAWFTNDIPVSLGPWKLYGLPGLILEAEDSNRKFLFTLKKLEIPYPNSTRFINYKVLEQKPITKEEFVKLERKKKDDDYRFKLARMDEATGEITDPATVKIKFAETIEIYK